MVHFPNRRLVDSYSSTGTQSIYPIPLATPFPAIFTIINPSTTSYRSPPFFLDFSTSSITVTLNLNMMSNLVWSWTYHRWQAGGTVSEKPLVMHRQFGSASSLTQLSRSPCEQHAMGDCHWRDSAVSIYGMLRVPSLASWHCNLRQSSRRGPSFRRPQPRPSSSAWPYADESCQWRHHALPPSPGSSDPKTKRFWG